MLKKINRGLTRKDFELSRDKGRLIHGNYFSVSIQSSPSATADDPSLTRRVEQTKVGFVVSKKISKRAVDRNRIKRLIAEAIRKLLITNDKLLINKKIVVLVKKNALGAKVGEIESCWKMIYEKINS